MLAQIEAIRGPRHRVQISTHPPHAGDGNPATRSIVTQPAGRRRAARAAGPRAAVRRRLLDQAIALGGHGGPASTGVGPAESGTGMAPRASNPGSPRACRQAGAARPRPRAVCSTPVKGNQARPPVVGCARGHPGRLLAVMTGLLALLTRRLFPARVPTWLPPARGGGTRRPSPGPPPARPGHPGSPPCPAASPGPVTLAFAGDVHFTGRHRAPVCTNPATALGADQLGASGAADFTAVNFENRGDQPGPAPAEDLPLSAPPPRAFNRAPVTAGSIWSPWPTTTSWTTGRWGLAKNTLGGGPCRPVSRTWASAPAPPARVGALRDDDRRREDRHRRGVRMVAELASFLGGDPGPGRARPNAIDLPPHSPRPAVRAAKRLAPVRRGVHALGHRGPGVPPTRNRCHWAPRAGGRRSQPSSSGRHAHMLQGSGWARAHVRGPTGWATSCGGSTPTAPATRPCWNSRCIRTAAAD